MPSPGLQLDLDTTLVKYGHASSVMNAPQINKPSRRGQTLPSKHTIFCGTLLPKSIWDARIVCGSNDNGYTDVMIDIEQCPGCCTGPCICRSLDDELRVPCTYTELLHELKLDGQSAWLQECSSQGIALGDYGHYSTHDGFNRRGNVFEDMQELGIDPIDSVYGLVVSRVSSCEHVLRCHDMP